MIRYFIFLIFTLFCLTGSAAERAHQWNLAEGNDAILQITNLSQEAKTVAIRFRFGPDTYGYSSGLEVRAGETRYLGLRDALAEIHERHPDLEDKSSGELQVEFPGTEAEVKTEVLNLNARTRVAPSVEAISAPVIRRIKPNRGSPDGGTIVTIAGENFRNSTTVSFGKIAALHNLESEGVLIAVTPPHNPGTVDIELANGKKVTKLRNAFTYSWDVPVLLSVDPETGSQTGGFRVVLRGKNFRPETIVRWNGEPVRTRYLSSESIALTAPPGSGAVTIEVGDAESPVTLKDAFEYRSALQITSITPEMGSTEGGYTVTVNGRNFASDCSVLFGNQYAPTVFVNENALAAVAPVGESGRVSISVTSADGSRDTLDGSFLYNNSPEIAAIHAEPEPIVRNTTSTITVYASDPEGGPLRYEYQVMQGPAGSTVTGHGDRATFRSPNTVGTAVVQVVVYDEHGAKAQENLQIKVE
jgi:hypothetical protein